MLLLELLWAVPLGILAWRAAVSGDPVPIRIAALAVIFIAFFGAVLVSAIPMPGGYSSAAGQFVHLTSTVLALIGSLYLLYWAAVTRDPPPHRLVSTVGGIAGLVPAILAIISATAFQEK